MVDGLNFKDFVAFLSAFSAKATMQHKIGCKCLLLNHLYWEQCLYLFKCITYVVPFQFATCSYKMEFENWVLATM
jgi:hypothetical protein